MLVNYIQSIGIDPNSPDGKRLLEECILCMAGVNTAFDFQHNVKTIDLKPTGMSGKDLRLKLMEHSYFTLNVKYAALFMGMSPTNADTYNKVQAYICTEDVPIFREVFARRKLKSRVKQHCINRHLGLPDITLHHMRVQKDLFDFHIAKVKKHIKFKVYKQMRFISKAENIPLDDLHSEVTLRVIRAYYQLLPTRQSSDYITNYLRSSASKCVVNMIKAYTTAKRGRMVKGAADGYGGNEFFLVCESENQHKAGADDAEYSYEGLSNAVSTEETRHVDSAILFERLLSPYVGRKRAALEILAGQNDDGFSAYLRKKKSIKEGDDHADYQRRVAHTTFLNSLADYLGVIREAFMKFISSIGDKLVAHREFA